MGRRHHERCRGPRPAELAPPMDARGGHPPSGATGVGSFHAPDSHGPGPHAEQRREPGAQAQMAHPSGDRGRGGQGKRAPACGAADRASGPDLPIHRRPGRRPARVELLRQTVHGRPELLRRALGNMLRWLSDRAAAGGTMTVATDACHWFYDRTRCGAILEPKPGNCCVYCSCATVPCPSIQGGAPPRRGPRRRQPEPERFKRVRTPCAHAFCVYGLRNVAKSLLLT